jgi:hypothetical protein
MINKTNRMKWTLGIAATAVAAIVAAETYEAFGSINSKEPNPSFSHPAEMMAGVTSYELKAEDGEHCKYTDDPQAASENLSEDEWHCEFQWNTNIEGLSNNGMTLSGIFSEAKTYHLPYTVNVYSGSEQEQVNVYNGTYAVDIVEPPVPEVVNATVDWKTETISGLTQRIGNPDSTLKSIKVEVKPQPYDQVLTFEGESCHVAQGVTACEVWVAGQNIVLDESDHGQEQFAILADSRHSYFEQTPSSFLTVDYDYRPPVFNRVEQNVQADNAARTLTVGETNYELAPGKVAVIFDSHQTAMDGDWWFPQSTKLDLVADETAFPTNALEVLGQYRYFTIPFFSSRDRVTLSEPVVTVLDGKIIYEYDGSEVPDGRYISEVDTRNYFEQGENIQDKYLTLSRFAPQIGFFTTSNEIYEQGSVYFNSELAIAAHGGWDDGSRVQELLIDGESVEFTGEPNIRQLTSAAFEGLVPGDTFELTAKAIDDAGNESEKTVTISYADATYAFDRELEDVYRDVEPLQVRVSRTGGDRCNMTLSQDVAQQIATGRSYGCYLEWDTIPDGMEPYAQGRNGGLQGVIRTPEAEETLSFNIVYVNEAGQSVSIPGAAMTFDMLEPKPIDLQFAPHDENEQGVVFLPYGERRVGTARLGFSRGVVEYEVITDDNEPYMSRSLSTSRPYTDGTIAIKEDNNVPFEIYKEGTLTLKAWYKYKPELRKEIVRDTIMMPSLQTQFRLEADTNEGHSLQTFNFTATLQTLTEEGWIYKPAMSGIYEVHLAKRTSDGFEPITESVTMNDGQVEFTLNAEEVLGVGNFVLYAMGTLQNEIQDGDREIQSNRYNMSLLSGEAVEGELQERTEIEGPTKLRAAVSFVPASRDDQRVISNLRWEKREENSSDWILVPDSQGDVTYSDRIEEPGKYDVRARMENRVTGEETITQPVTIIAYDKPRVYIDGPEESYTNHPSTFHARTRDNMLASGDGEFEWSFDGENWEPGEEVLTVVKDSSYQLFLRFRDSQTDDLIGDEGWSIVDQYVRVEEPQPVRLRGALPRFAEVGEDFELLGDLRASIRAESLSTHIEWETMDGTVMDNMSIYTVKSEDINEDNTATFLLRGWVNGLKEETFNEVEVSTMPWEYHIPEMSIETRTAHKIAPVTAKFSVRMERIFAPGVEWSFEWEDIPGATLVDVSSDGQNAVFEITEPGVHEITAHFTDTRGNEVELNQFFDALKPAELDPVLELRYSEPFMRPPLSVVAQMTAARTHPDDRLDRIEWFIDGESLGEPNRYGRYDLEEAGSYELRGVLYTELGQQTEITETIVVNENKPPVCSPELINRTSSMEIQTNCTDEDGSISKFQWYWDGQNMGRERNDYLRFSLDTFPELKVRFRAYDDSGDYDEHELSW